VHVDRRVLLKGGLTDDEDQDDIDDAVEDFEDMLLPFRPVHRCAECSAEVRPPRNLGPLDG
jgi:hypothetical protein